MLLRAQFGVLTRREGGLFDSTDSCATGLQRFPVVCVEIHRRQILLDGYVETLRLKAMSVA